MYRHEPHEEAEVTSMPPILSTDCYLFFFFKLTILASMFNVGVRSLELIQKQIQQYFPL